MSALEAAGYTRTKAYAGYGGSKGAFIQPTVDYLRALGPGLHTIDPVKVGAALGIQPASVRKNLCYLADAKVLKFQTEQGYLAGMITVRMNDA